MTDTNQPPHDENKLIAERRAKLDKLRASGAVAFPNPVFVGDTLYGESVVESRRLSSSRPGEGIVVLGHTARNQDGVVVATASRTMLVWTREAGEQQGLAGGGAAASGSGG